MRQPTDSGPPTFTADCHDHGIVRAFEKKRLRDTWEFPCSVSPRHVVTVPPAPVHAALSIEEALVDEVAAQRRRVLVPLAEHQVDHRLAVAVTGLELLGEHVEHDEPLAPRGRDARQTPVAHEGTEHLGRLGVGSLVAGAPASAGPRPAGREGNACASNERAIVAALDEPGLDEPRERTPGRPSRRDLSRA